MIRAQNDNPDVVARGVFGPSRWAIFLPTAIVAAGYVFLVSWLFWNDRSQSHLFRLALVILAIGMPVMVVHGLLRAFTIRLTPMASSVQVYRGFPRAEPVEIPYSVIEEMSVRRGLGGRITGAGTVIFELLTGQRVTVCDIEDPDEAIDAIRVMMAAENALEEQVPDAGNHSSAAGL